MENITVTFNGRKLKSEIVASGMTQNEVATALDVHRNTVSGWVRGNIAPSIEKLAEVYAVLGHPADGLDCQFIGDWYTVTQEANR